MLGTTSIVCLYLLVLCSGIIWKSWIGCLFYLFSCMEVQISGYDSCWPSNIALYSGPLGAPFCGWPEQHSIYYWEQNIEMEKGEGCAKGMHMVDCYFCLESKLVYWTIQWFITRSGLSQPGINYLLTLYMFHDLWIIIVSFNLFIIITEISRAKYYSCLSFFSK